MTEEASLNKLRSKQERIVKLTRKHFKAGLMGVDLLRSLFVSALGACHLFALGRAAREESDPFIYPPSLVSCWRGRNMERSRTAAVMGAVCCTQTGRALSFHCLAC
jgi:hypothetical protein